MANRGGSSCRLRYRYARILKRRSCAVWPGEAKMALKPGGFWRFDPIRVDHGRDLGLHEGAFLFEGRQFIGAQGLREVIEIAVRRRKLLRYRRFECCDGDHLDLYSFTL